MTASVGEGLRPLAEPDLERVLAWRNHPSVRRAMLDQHEIGSAEHRQWFERTAHNPRRRLLVFERAGLPLGFVGFGIEAGATAEWGFYAAPGAPRGTGTALGRAALRYAFAESGWHRLYGRVLAFNTASLRLHRTLGFQPEGILRQHCWLQDGHHDLHCLGLLRREWSEHDR